MLQQMYGLSQKHLNKHGILLSVTLQITLVLKQ